MSDMKEQIERPRKVALYKSLDNDFYMLDELRMVTFDANFRTLPDGEARERVISGFMRVSEAVEITLPPLTDDSIVQKAVESLNDAERKAINEFNAKIAAIREQKSQLLALRHGTIDG